VLGPDEVGKKGHLLQRVRKLRVTGFDALLYQLAQRDGLLFGEIDDP